LLLYILTNELKFPSDAEIEDSSTKILYKPGISQYEQISFCFLLKKKSTKKILTYNSIKSLILVGLM